VLFSLAGTKTYSSDEVMISMLSTLKAQLLPQVTVANCCSDFHQMLNDFLYEGCGTSSTNTFQCLQDTNDPFLVPCCRYHFNCWEKKKRLNCPSGVNSEAWLRGPRVGNIHKELDGYDHLVQHMLLGISNIFVKESFSKNDPLLSLLEQTLCLPQSPFLNVSIPSNVNELVIRRWAVKLIYLSIHFHQHKFALPEAEQRYKSINRTEGCSPVSQVELFDEYGVGRYDYECPNAKFLVLPLGGNGLGANVRNAVVPALMLGLMTDRVVLLMNNVPRTFSSPNDFIHHLWLLSSCPRLDYQCFFWPLSPCVLTEHDLENAYALNISESRKLRENDMSYAAHHRVWIWQPDFDPINGYHVESGEKLYEYAKELISPISERIDPQYKNVLQQAAELIRASDGYRAVFNFAAGWSKVQHTFTMYMMRPHPQISKKLEALSTDVVPNNFNPDNAMGLLVRGTSNILFEFLAGIYLTMFHSASDKCDAESECLSFGQHMTVLAEMWGKHLNDTDSINSNENPSQYSDPSIIFTTEATSMVEEQKAFVSENRTVLRYPHFRFSFITNQHDVTPNSGFLRDSRG
jgi:hypothetical protein